MRKIVLIYGVIAGFLMDVLSLISFSLMEQGVLSFENSELFGYTTMIIVFSLIFFGIKSFRDKYGDGTITFGKGFKVGLLTASIASLMYATGWEVYYNTVPGVSESFIQRYTDLRLKKMKYEGKSQEEIDQTMTEMKSFAEMYKNPFTRFGITVVEIFPIGLLVTVISAGVLRKKAILPA